MSEECLRILIQALVIFLSYEMQKNCEKYLEKNST